MAIPGVENNLGTLLEKASAICGDKTAIHFDHEDLTLSYRQLNERANQFANALRTEGIKRGDHVAVMLPNCPEFPLTWLALAKLGAVMVPLNNRYQSIDLEYVLNDSDSSTLVIDTEYIHTFLNAWPRTPRINKLFRVGEGHEDIGNSLTDLSERAFIELTTVDTCLNDLANIQYTSGTTGFPKGCKLTHEYWLTMGMMTKKLFNQEDVYLCVNPFYYVQPQGNWSYA